MTKTDFAELKEKLADMSDDFDYKKHIDKYYSENSIPHKLYKNKIKSAAIISELIEIISLQNKEVESYARYIYCTENCKLSTSWSDHAKCTCGAEKLKNSVKAALSETNTRLQKLREGK